MAKKYNVVGPQIRKIRYQNGLTQEQLVARCARVGLDITRSALAKIEARTRNVNDSELIGLSKALQVKLEQFLPPHR